MSSLHHFKQGEDSLSHFETMQKEGDGTKRYAVRHKFQTVKAFSAICLKGSQNNVLNSRE